MTSALHRSGDALSAAVLSTAAAFALAGCAGDEFAACEQCGDAAAGSSGTAGTGGSAGRGGSSGRGGSGGAPDAGGRSGSGGTGGTGDTGGTGGSGGTVSEGFPRTQIRDDFNTANGALQDRWVGNRDAFAVVNQQLAYVAGPCNALLWQDLFGVEQEVFATLAKVNPQSDEINVVLKAQGPSDCEMLEVFYSPLARQLELAYCTNSVWTTIGQGIPLTLGPGDQLGARYYGNHQVEVFVNGVRTAIFDASDYPYAGMGGQIGINCEGAADGTTAWDDFGGG